MKKFSHAWLAFKAIERLKKADLPNDRQDADELIRWFWNYRDGVIAGAWYPDQVIKDMATSHVYKLAPAASGESVFRSLPASCQTPAVARQVDLYQQPFVLTDPANNLPERCEALSHSIVDNFKMQETEEKGSPIVPTDNHIAMRMFMLSHYIADAHMPLHSDSRQFSKGADVHARLEEVWDREIARCYRIDQANQRFYYDPEGFPLRSRSDDDTSFLRAVNEGLAVRPFSLEYGAGNTNVRTHILAVCQHAYLLSFAFIPKGYDDTNVTGSSWKALPGQLVSLDQLGQLVFSDAIDAIARVWLRVWRRYQEWKKLPSGGAQP